MDSKLKGSLWELVRPLFVSRCRDTASSEAARFVLEHSGRIMDPLVLSSSLY